MASAEVFGSVGAAKASSVICGALAASFSIIGIWEVTRGLRWVNSVIGCSLLIAVFVFDFGGSEMVSGFVAGLLIIATSLVRGTVKHRTGGGWKALLSHIW